MENIHIMRTNIVIDDGLMKETLSITGLKTKKDVVELALKTLLQLRKQERVRELRGKIDWQGDLNDMRLDTRPLETGSDGSC